MNINLTHREKILLAPLSQLVEGLIKNQDEFITELAKELMLDELLCGECDSKQFLIDTMKRIAHEQKVKRFERLLTRAKNEGEDVW